MIKVAEIGYNALSPDRFSLRFRPEGVMKLSLCQSAVAVAVAVTLASGAATAQAGRPEQQTAAVGSTVVVRHPGAVSGIAWHHDDTPVSHALLRLRDVATGRVVMNTQADAAGRFTFSPVAPGGYLVELVDRDGHVRGVSQMFSIVPDETVATFIRLGAHVPWYQGFFTGAAAAVLASAASLGVTAVGDGGQPASARN